MILTLDSRLSASASPQFGESSRFHSFSHSVSERKEGTAREMCALVLDPHAVFGAAEADE